MSTSNAAATVHPTWIQQFALKILGIVESFWEQFKPVLEQDVQALLSSLLPIAISVVTSLLTDSAKTSAQKRDAAATQIAADAKAAGIAAGTQAINLAIEMALASIKSPAAVSAPVQSNGGAAPAAPAVN